MTHDLPPGTTRYLIVAAPIWSGACWSVARAVVATASAAVLPWWCLPAAAALALGWRARLAAAVLLACWMALRAGFHFSDTAIGFALLLQIRVPGNPYGSWDRKGHPDPGSDWRFPLDAWALALLMGMVNGPGWHWLLAVPWGWIPPKRAPGPDLVEYDAECGLCHGFVRLLIAEGRDNFRFRGGVTGGSVVVDGRTRAEAVLYTLERMGGPWRLLGLLGRAVPRRFADAAYDFVAARRRRFGPPFCPPIPPHLRRLFVPPTRLQW